MKQEGNIRNTLLLFSIFLFLAGTGSIASPAMAEGYLPAGTRTQLISGS